MNECYPDEDGTVGGPQPHLLSWIHFSTNNPYQCEKPRNWCEDWQNRLHQKSEEAELKRLRRAEKCLGAQVT